MRRLPRLSYANVIATIALFVALGGTGYAAFKLPKNSVGNRQLKRNAVTTTKIKNGAITSRDIKATTKAALKGKVAIVMRQGADVTITANGFAKAEATCDPGEQATGGGLYNEANVNSVYITSSYPTPNPTTAPPTGNGQTPTGWRVWAHNNLPATNLTVTPYVLCTK